MLIFPHTYTYTRQEVSEVSMLYLSSLSSVNSHDITEILLKVISNTINLTSSFNKSERHDIAESDQIKPTQTINNLWVSIPKKFEHYLKWKQNYSILTSDKRVYYQNFTVWSGKYLSNMCDVFPKTNKLKNLPKLHGNFPKSWKWKLELNLNLNGSQN